MSNLFSFIPKTEAEIAILQNRSLLVEGIYPFEVKEAKITTSKSGNTMLQLKLHLGQAGVIFDYLPATDEMMFKLKHFCESVGMDTEYSTGKFHPDHTIHRKGSAKIGIQKGKPKPDGSGMYPEKNVVRDYIKTAINFGQNSFNDDRLPL